MKSSSIYNAALMLFFVLNGCMHFYSMPSFSSSSASGEIPVVNITKPSRNDISGKNIIVSGNISQYGDISQVLVFASYVNWTNNFTNMVQADLSGSNFSAVLTASQTAWHNIWALAVRGDGSMFMSPMVGLQVVTYQALAIDYINGIYRYDDFEYPVAPYYAYNNFGPFQAGLFRSRLINAPSNVTISTLNASIDSYNTNLNTAPFDFTLIVNPNNTPLKNIYCYGYSSDGNSVYVPYSIYVLAYPTNYKSPIVENGGYRFVFDPTAPFNQAAFNPDYIIGVYLSGSFNGWSASDSNYILKNTNGHYEIFRNDLPSRSTYRFTVFYTNGNITNGPVNYPDRVNYRTVNYYDLSNMYSMVP